MYNDTSNRCDGVTSSSDRELALLRHVRPATPTYDINNSMFQGSIVIHDYQLIQETAHCLIRLYGPNSRDGILTKFPTI